MILNIARELDKLQNRITPISGPVIDQMPNALKAQVKLIDEYVTPLFGVEKVENGYFYEGHKLSSIYYDPAKKKLIARITIRMRAIKSNPFCSFLNFFIYFS